MTFRFLIAMVRTAITARFPRGVFFSFFRLIPFVSLFILFSCKTEKRQTLFTLEENTGINFNNSIVDGEVENSFYFRNFYNGGGVALGDINNDGYADVFLTSNMGENKLYLNSTKQAGAIRFEDITA